MSTKSRKKASSCTMCSKHDFTTREIRDIRSKLLHWYNENRRQLPWRDVAKTEKDDNVRGYSIWVSETMLQQTQVKTVIEYYSSWMKKFPTIRHLAESNLDDVNRLWAGLGYYSRARRLHEGARFLVESMDANMPQSAADLLRIPGIGRYTSAAIASIAYAQPVGVVDGNVSRVLSRLRIIGKDIKCSSVVEKMWELADRLVCPDHPGDFNQAMMELGATICTPRNPRCAACPLREECMAYKQVEERKKKHRSDLLEPRKKKKIDKIIKEDTLDIEDGISCTFCLPNEDLDTELGVCCFPQKAAKKAPRRERSAVIIIEHSSARESEFLTTRTPEGGLLAGLWEFPCYLLDEALAPTQQEKAFQAWLKEELNLDLGGRDKKKTKVGEVVHQFSHIHRTYQVHHLTIENKGLITTKSDAPIQWLTKEEFLRAAVSTAMRKVFSLLSCRRSTGGGNQVAIKRKRSKTEDSCKSKRTISSYFERQTS